LCFAARNHKAGAIIINIGPDEFIVAGKGLEIFFTSAAAGELPRAAIDFVDEGTFKMGNGLQAGD
jgi:hypothetical protein